MLQSTYSQTALTYMSQVAQYQTITKDLTLVIIVYVVCHKIRHDNKPWWRHQMETFSTLLAFCEGNPPVIDGFPSAVTPSFDVFFNLHRNKRLSKQSKRRWFDTPSRSLWRHFNDWTKHQKRLSLLALNLDLITSHCQINWFHIMNLITYWSDFSLD